MSPPQEGQVVLREFSPTDVALAIELSTDPYVPLIGTLPAQASEEQALDWIDRQRGERLAQRRGLSLAIAETDSNRAVGQIGLWLAELDKGRATVGYGVGPSARGRGIAAEAPVALTRFAWTIPELHRIELYIEPRNIASIRTAERAGYQREGLLRSHQEIGGVRRNMLLYAAIRSDNDPEV